MKRDTSTVNHSALSNGADRASLWQPQEGASWDMNHVMFPSAKILLTRTTGMLRREGGSINQTDDFPAEEAPTIASHLEAKAMAGWERQSNAVEETGEGCAAAGWLNHSQWKRQREAGDLEGDDDKPLIMRRSLVLDTNNPGSVARGGDELGFRPGSKRTQKSVPLPKLIS